MKRQISAGFAALCLLSPAWADEAAAPRAGLMWNKTGLPAVFPLQVQTDPGQNYYLKLEDTETGAPALAAFIEGGAHFRVLVPPGTFDLSFATGEAWQGEEALFGPETQRIVVSDPLTFAVKGLRTKSGYWLDLREE